MIDMDPSGALFELAMWSAFLLLAAATAVHIGSLDVTNAAFDEWLFATLVAAIRRWTHAKKSEPGSNICVAV